MGVCVLSSQCASQIYILDKMSRPLNNTDLEVSPDSQHMHAVMILGSLVELYSISETSFTCPRLLRNGLLGQPKLVLSLAPSLEEP